jgi:hypothetical protein
MMHEKPLIKTDLLLQATFNTSGFKPRRVIAERGQEPELHRTSMRSIQ